MKLVQYQCEWRGIAFRDLPIALPPGARAEAAFYSAFYEALARHTGKPDASWYAQKEAIGAWIEANILSSYRSPRVISLGAGEAVAERLWLQHGLNVTLNECQDISLGPVLASFPGAKAIIGEAAKVKLDQKYDVAVMLTIDYAMSDAELRDTFANVAKALTKDGVIVSNTVNSLTFLQAGKEAIKRGVLRTYKTPGYVVWGWSRTPGSIIHIAEQAGLEPSGQWIVNDSGFEPRARPTWRTPTFARPNMIMTFRPRRETYASQQQ